MLAALLSCPPLVVALVAVDVALLIHALWRDEARGEAHEVSLDDAFAVGFAGVVSVSVLAVVSLLGSLVAWAMGGETSVWLHLAALVVGLLPTALAAWLIVPLRHRSRASLAGARLAWGLALLVAIGLIRETLDVTSWRQAPAMLVALAPQLLVGAMACRAPSRRFELTRRWDVYPVGGLHLHVPVDTPADQARGLAARTHAALLAIEEQLDTRCPGPVRVFLFADLATMRQACQVSEGVLGLAFRRSVALSLGDWDTVGGTLVHELGHAVLRARLERNTWSLLNEGLAEYLRRSLHGESRAYDAAPAPTTSAPLHMMARDEIFLETPPGSSGTGHHYEHGLSLVAHLVATGGMARLVALFDHASELPGKTPGQALDEAVQAVYGEPLGWLETHWRQGCHESAVASADASRGPL